MGIGATDLVAKEAAQDGAQKRRKRHDEVSGLHGL